MIYKMRAAVLALALASTTAALAQVAQVAQPQPGTAVAATLAPVPESNVLRVGTEVSLKMREELSTLGKKLRVGQRFQMEVAEPVTVGGQIVIPVGSPATGEVTEVRNKGMWGKSGYINGRVLYAQVNGRQIRLTGSLDDKGKTGTAGVVASVALVPLAGFFVTGTSAVIPVGAPVRAFVDEDIAVAFAPAPAPAPLTVPTAAPVAVTPTAAAAPEAASNN